MLATTFYPLLRIWSLHLIEPFLLGERVKSWGFDFIGMAEQQRDMWPSSEDAFQSLRVHPALRICDERILKLFAVSFFLLYPLLYMTAFVVTEPWSSTVTYYRIPWSKAGCDA